LESRNLLKKNDKIQAILLSNAVIPTHLLLLLLLLFLKIYLFILEREHMSRVGLVGEKVKGRGREADFPLNRQSTAGSLISGP